MSSSPAAERICGEWFNKAISLTSHKITFASCATIYQVDSSASKGLSDVVRGSQYAAAEYHKLTKAAGMLQSMSRKGNCWDNAPIESCFGTLKTELVYQTRFPTLEAAKRELFAYIEGYYNRQRLHSASATSRQRKLSGKPLKSGVH